LSFSSILLRKKIFGKNPNIYSRRKYLEKIQIFTQEDLSEAFPPFT
jgi:hypothetical protein